jgi:activator of 2-hydroxyglutaryl-CoA dehydratase
MPVPREAGFESKSGRPGDARHRLDPRERKSMSKIIGIDLGTTNSVVAVMEGDSPRC